MGSSPLKRSHPPENGIAIGPILFVVALLAVLVSAIAAGSGSFSGDTSEVKIKAQATAILGYADELQIGVDRVMSRCPDTQFSLANSVDSGYAENPLAPTDKSCHVFDVNGGGILFKEPPPDVDLTAVPAELRHYIVHTGNEIEGMGITDIGRDLIIMLPGLRKELCLKINDMVGVPMVSGDAPTGVHPQTSLKGGDYYATNANGYNLSCGVFRGKPTCCIKASLSDADPRIPIGTYVFYHALHVR